MRLLPFAFRRQHFGTFLPLILSLFLASPSTQAGVILDAPNSRITDAGLGRFGSASKPNLASLGNEIYATWLDDRDNDQNSVLFARSIDRGRTWSSNVRVSVLPYDNWCDNPQITVQPNGTLWISWYLFYTADSEKANDLRIARSTNQGATWDLFTVKDGTGHDDLWKSRIASDSNHVYLAFHDFKSTDFDEGYNIVLYTIDTASLQFRETQVNDIPRTGRITDGLLDDGPSFDMAMRTTDRGTWLCLAWEDARDQSTIYCACSTNQGETFAPSTPLSGTNAVNPQIALSPNGTLFATYTLDSDPDNNILLRSSSDLGSSWSPVRQVTQIDLGRGQGWDLAVDDSGQIVLPWIENFFGESNLNLSTSRDSGITFATEFDIEDDQGQFPSVSSQAQVHAVVGSGTGAEQRVYLAWGDDRNSQDEIWFTSALLDSTPPTTPNNFKATPADSAIQLSWIPSTDAHGIRGYQITRGTSAQGPFNPRSVLDVQDTPYTDVGLEPGVTYFYQVTAIDSTGNLSAPSDIASAAAILTSVQPTGILLYERDQSIHLRPLGGGPEQIIPNALEPVLSNDGTLLYHRNDTNIFAQTLSTNGTLGTPRLFHGREGLFEFDIASDNLHFAFIASRIQFSTLSGTCLVTEPTHATPTQDLFTDLYNISSHVSISADHQWMAFRYDGFCNGLAFGSSKPGDFCIANLQTQQRQCVQGADVNGSDFAPSGNRVVMAAAIGGQRELWLADVTPNGTLTQSVQITRGAPNQPADRPRFSSDGQWIVFQRDVNPDPAENARNWRLYAVRTDGTSIRPLNIAGTHPALRGGGSATTTGWSPNARVITGIGISGDTLTLTFSAEMGIRTLERTLRLENAPVWTRLATIPARTNDLQTVTTLTLKLSELIGNRSTDGYFRVGPLGSL